MKIVFFYRLKDKHPRMWCVLFCLVFALLIPLALLYEIVVGISVELLRKIHNLVMYNSFTYVIVKEFRASIMFIAAVKRDVVKQWNNESENETDGKE